MTHIASKHPVEGAQYLPAHRRGLRYDCTQCDRFFSNKSELAKHVHIVHDVDSWLDCPKCDKKLKNAQQLRSHFLSKHLNIAIRPNTCKLCDNSYVREKDLWIHIGLKHEGAGWESVEPD